jgi:hypothetical protein
MLRLTKFICGCFGMGVLVLLGMSLIQPSVNGSQSRVQGSPSSVSDSVVQSANVVADSIFRQTSNVLGPQVRSYSAVSSKFVSTNATAASLQLSGMKSGLSSYFSVDTWRHGSTPYWIQTGVQGAAQTSSAKTLALAKSMPVVRAVRSDLDRLANAHPSLSAAASSF